MPELTDKKKSAISIALRRVLYVVPLVLGTAGYLMSGAGVLDALYSSICLYTMNASLPDRNVLIELARWLAPLSAATAVITEITGLRRRAVCDLQSLSRDSAAVYSDTGVTIRNDGGGRRILYPGARFLKHAKRHIILFSTDVQSLAFYESHKAQMAGARVYVGLREIEPGLVCSAAGANVKLVDISSAAARMLWKRLRLWEVMRGAPHRPVHIVIYGESMLAEELLCCGLLLNLYSAGQQVYYHMVSPTANFKHKHPGLDTMNRDAILFHDPVEESTWETIRSADLVLVADVPQLADLQVLAANTDAARLYVYANGAAEADAYIGLGGQPEREKHRFGQDTELLTFQNICEDALIEDAIRVNEEYGNAYPQYATAWNELDRFTQNSNISAVDYGAVLGELIMRHSAECGVSLSELADKEPEYLEQLAELEHIRWCRFHFLNYWRYGIPDKQGTQKDKQKRIHADLVPYGELDAAERDKDRDYIRTVIQKLMTSGEGYDVIP